MSAGGKWMYKTALAAWDKYPIGEMLTAETWRAQREAYLQRVGPWADDRVRRSRQHKRHPVYDFMFEYYSFRPAHLLRWTPGFGVTLAGASKRDVEWEQFSFTEFGLALQAQAFSAHRISYLRWCIEYLATVSERAPLYSCYGLHEWAMVYKSEKPRYSSIPCRLGSAGTDQLVEELPIRCTHYDAYRFFTKEAMPLNRTDLDREQVVSNDQPACLHVNMDNYKFAYKIAPFCPSEVLGDAFVLALAAREIDMRASPYDLTAFGVKPIKIETIDGRAEYVDLQKELFLQGQAVRKKLLVVYSALLHALS